MVFCNSLSVFNHGFGFRSIFREALGDQIEDPIVFEIKRNVFLFGKNVKALLNHGQMLFKQSRQRIPTGQLNRLLREAIRHTPPPMYQNRRPKIYYGTQVGVQPPTLVLFCSAPAGISKPYQRYLLGAVRDQLDFEEVPIKLYLRKRQQHDLRDEITSDDSETEPPIEEASVSPGES